MRRFTNFRIILVLLTATLLFNSGCKTPLPEWMRPGVREGAGTLTKTQLLKFDDLGTITDIQFGELRLVGKKELGVAGNYGARFFDAVGTPQGETQFAVRQPDEFDVSAYIVGQTDASGIMFYRHAGAKATYDSLVGSDGKEVWRISQKVAGEAFGTIDAKIGPEFFSADQSGDKNGNVEARGTSGKVIWSREGIARWNSAVGLVKADSNKVNLVLNSGQTLVVLDAEGRTISQHKTPINVSDFIVVTWHPLCPEGCLMVSETDDLALLTTSADHVLAKLPATYLEGIRATAVALFPDRPPVLAVVGSLHYQGWKLAGFEAVHGALYIYDGDGHLMYHEIFPEAAQAVAAVPGNNPNLERLLVGGVNKVWEYDPLVRKR